MPLSESTAQALSTGFSEKLHSYVATPDRNNTKVLKEILEELRTIRKHMDRSRWLGPEGEAFLKQITAKK